MSAPVCVLDASVGVKWFRNEAGSVRAREVLEHHVRGELVIAVDSLFLYEVMAVAAREGSSSDVARIWSDLGALDLVVVPLGDELVGAAARARATLGCALYDAFSAGLAELLEAPLYSADARAHGAYPGVRLLHGEESA